MPSAAVTMIAAKMLNNINSFLEKGLLHGFLPSQAVFSTVLRINVYLMNMEFRAGGDYPL